MSQTWKNDFQEINSEYPNKIVLEYFKELYEITDKKIIAKLEIFEQNISDMNKPPAIFNSIMNITNIYDKGSSIQEKLGEVGEYNKFTYEMYITGNKITNYKFRFAFLEYGIVPYPVKIAVDIGIATELGYEKTIIECNNEEEFRKILESIFNSNRLTEIIKGLIVVNT